MFNGGSHLNFSSIEIDRIKDSHNEKREGDWKGNSGENKQGRAPKGIAAEGTISKKCCNKKHIERGDRKKRADLVCKVEKT